MKVLGSKFIGQENAVFLIDSDKKEPETALFDGQEQ